VGKGRSIAVTERVIKTLKYEWLRRVPLIKGFDHLTLLWPDDVYYKREPESPKRDAKTVSGNIERHVFVETHLTACCLKTAA
jgi:hypothetical protein